MSTPTNPGATGSVSATKAANATNAVNTANMANKIGAKAQIYAVGDAHYLLQTGPDYIGVRLRAGQVWEPVTLQLADMLLQGIASPVVLDIGANLGAFSVPMGLKLLPRSGKIYAFEPQRMVYYQLCANLFMNGLHNGYAHNLAVGSAEGSIDVPVLNVYTDQNLGALSLDPAVRKLQGLHGQGNIGDAVEQMRMIALDTFNLPNANMLKIDVEGFELPVLQGAAQYIKLSGYPTILFEMWGEERFKQLAQALTSYITIELGYQIFTMGELSIAQHPNNTRLAFARKPGQNGSVEVTRLAPPISITASAQSAN